MSALPSPTVALLDPRQALAAPLPGANAAADAAAWREVSALLLEPLVQGLAHGSALDASRPFAEEAAQSMLCQHLAQHLARADGLGLGRLMDAGGAEKKPKT